MLRRMLTLILLVAIIFVDLAPIVRAMAPTSPSPAITPVSTTGSGTASTTALETAIPDGVVSTATTAVSLEESSATQMENTASADDSQAAIENDWDPWDPAAVEFSNGSWGVAFVDSGPNLHYRRSLENSNPPYWLDPVTVETGADAPALVELGSTLALFYRKSTGGVQQVFLRTSTNDGITWSAPTQLTTETVSVYQIQAVNDAGTVYVFWSLSDTSGLLHYRTSTDLINWSTKATVGQAIGPLVSYTSPSFDIERLASGEWALIWLNAAQCQTTPEPCGSIDRSAMGFGTGYPNVWYGRSPDLATTPWPYVRELTRPYRESWPKGLSLAQVASGTLYVSYSRRDAPWDYYTYYRTSPDGGVTWTTATQYGYEPARDRNGGAALEALNSYLVADSNGGIRAFWDQYAATGVAGGPNGYSTRIFWRDLPNGEITQIPPTQEILTHCGCDATAAYAADPVNVTIGNFTLPETDITIPGRGLGLVFRRTYNSLRLIDGPLGFGWTHNYDTRLASFSQGEVIIVDGSGRSDLFIPDGGGGYTPPPGQFSTLVHNADGTWTLTETNQIKRTFSADGKLIAIADRNDNTVTLTYDASGLLTTVTDPAGRSLSFTYNGPRIASITDPLNRTIAYSYSPAGDLMSVVDARGKTWAYTYDTSHRMLTKVDPNNHTVLTNTYGTLNRVVSQKDAKNAVTTFSYGEGVTAVTDPLGNTTTYNFDTKYRVTKVTDPNGKVIEYTYDARNNLTQIKDSRKSPTNVTTFTYDTRGNVLTHKNGLNHTWTYTYNAFNDVLTETDPLNHTTTYTYDAKGNLTAITNAKNETTTFGRDSFGQLTSITDARNKTTTFGYDTYGNQTTITNPLNKTWTTAYDLAGRKTSITDPLNHVTSFDYDANDNLLSVTDARGKVTSYTYDDANNRITATDPNLKVTTFGYDEKNRLISVTDAANGVTAYEYDANDNLTKVTDANNHVRTFTYDKNNRLLTETDALGNVTRYEYDGAGNLIKRTDANNSATTYTYDTINRLTSATYPQGSISYSYDNANRRTSMTDATGTTTYSYDELNRLTSVTFPGNRVVAYQYDAAGNRTRITYPDNKTVDYTFDDANRLSTVTDWLSKVTSYTYDDAGRLITTTFPTGVTETRTYNEADQLTSIVATRGSTTLTSFTYTLDDAGLRTAVQDLDGTESYTYDNLYRLTGVTYADNTTQSYTYDAVGNRLTKIEGTTTTNYTYDAADRLTAAGNDSYTYDRNGSLLTRTTGGTTTAYCYDGLNRLTAAVSQGNCAIRVNAGGASYTDGLGQFWDGDRGFSAGSVATSTAAIGNTTDDVLYQSARYLNTPFSYDFDVPNGSYTVTLKFAENWLSAAGQRVFDVAIEGTIVLDDFDIFAAAGGKNLAVDRSFPVTVSDGTLNIAFSKVVGDPLVSAIEIVPSGGPATAIASYAYRGDGLRHSKTVGGTTTTYTWDVNASLPIILQDGMYTYVYGHGLISQTDNAGTQTYFLTNGLGSTEALTDASGAVVAATKYDVFGGVRTSTGTAATEYRFTGQQDDADLGFIYLRARYYDPSTGRFISKDPFPGTLENPVSQHPYVYAHNNPVNWTDSTGECIQCIFRFAVQLAQRAGPPISRFAQSAWQTGGRAINWCANLLSRQGETVSTPRNRALHEAYKAGLRQQMQKPLVSDARLQRIIDDLYRPGARIGSGSTADAIRFERATGQQVGGKLHSQKGEEYIRALERWLRTNPTARPGDRAAAENIILDLKDALGH